MDIQHEDFEKVLGIIKERLRESIEFEEIRSIESNLDTKGMIFKHKESSLSGGMIIVGEDNGLIAVDVNMSDGEVISFFLKDIEDKEGLDNIINWFLHI
jgi:hypothetical protein